MAHWVQWFSWYNICKYIHTHIYIYIINCFFQNKLRIIIRGYPFKICAQLNLAHAEAPGDKGDAAIGQITGHAMAPLIAADVLSGHGRVTLRYTENKWCGNDVVIMYSFKSICIYISNYITLTYQISYCEKHIIYHIMKHKTYHIKYHIIYSIIYHIINQAEIR